jgi:Leucine-rich repeat (LRR) protein
MQAWTAEMGLAEAKRRIANCEAERSDTLDLGGLRLQVLPDALKRLTSLKRLFLGGNAVARADPNLAYTGGDFNAQFFNQLTALPSWFDELGSLEVLDLSYNGIGDEGARALSALTGLTTLDLGITASGPRARGRCPR